MDVSTTVSTTIEFQLVFEKNTNNITLLNYVFSDFCNIIIIIINYKLIINELYYSITNKCIM